VTSADRAAGIGTGSDAPRPRVLVVDDADGIRSYLADLLELRGWAVDTAEDGRRALALLEAGADPDVVVLDVMLPGMDGLEVLRRVRAAHADVPVVMLSVVGRASTIVEAMQQGAADYVSKPFDEQELEAVLARALAARRPDDGPAGDEPEGEGEPVWGSASMRRIRDVLEQVADVDVTVLVQGESGTGKEIVARTLHELSGRREQAFVKVNCAALPDELLESELFGYEKGAFTGAHGRKPGKFEVADGGTIFLDEIGEMTPPLQAKLLQVLQDASFSRLGGNREIQVDVRVVCATNRPLLEMVQAGGFREDLFFRLNVVNVELPPLRERREEIPDLVRRFLRRYAARYAREPRPLSEALLRAFERYPFPGNVRELENLVKRIVVLESEDAVRDELARREAGERRRGHRMAELLDEMEATAGELPLKEVGRRAAALAERETIEQALARTDWNRKRAAELLGVSYKTLLHKIRECGIEAE